MTRGNASPADIQEAHFSLVDFLPRSRTGRLALAGALATAWFTQGKTAGDAEAYRTVSAALSVNAAADTNIAAPDFSDLPRTIIYYANERDGYVIGNVTSGDTVVYSDQREKDYTRNYWRLARILHRGYPGDDECAWIEEEKVAEAGDDIRVKRQADICADKAEQLEDRDNIASDANCDEHECNGASHTVMDLRGECADSLYLNYDQAHGVSYNKLPDNIQSGFRWRTRTKDGKKLWGQVILKFERGDRRVRLSVWPQVRRSCFRHKLPYNGPPLPPRYTMDE